MTTDCLEVEVEEEEGKWYTRLLVWKKDLGNPITIYMTSPEEHTINVHENETIKSVVERAAELLGIQKTYTRIISLVFSDNEIPRSTTVREAGICDEAEFRLLNAVEVLQAQEMQRRERRERRSTEYRYG